MSAETKQQAKETLAKVLGITDSSGSQDIHRLIDELLSDKNLEGKTDLNQNQIVAISRAAWYAEQYDSKAMRSIIRLVTKYLQSKNRLGRQELVNSIIGMFKYDLEQGKQEKVTI